MRVDAWFAIAAGLSSVPPFSKQKVIPVARKLWLPSLVAMRAVAAPADHRIGVRLREHGARQFAGAAAAVLSPALAFLVAIAVEILIGTLMDAGMSVLLPLAVAVGLGWFLLRRRSRSGR